MLTIAKNIRQLLTSHTRHLFRQRRFLIAIFLPGALFLATGAAESYAYEWTNICRYCRSELADGDGSKSRFHQYAPDRTADVLHLRLDVTPNFKRKTVSGVATLRLQPVGKPLTELRLDGLDLDVSAVRSSQQIANYSVSKTDITLYFVEPIPTTETFEVDIHYSAQPSKGLYFRTADMGHPENETHCWTQGEPYEARHWYPCFDSPNERCSTEVICHVPADMIVLSNGVRMGEELDEETGFKAVRWLQEKTHANYLLCLVAGYFEKLEGKHGELPLRFFTQASLAEHADSGFAETREIIAFFEEETGVPFPWDKYDQVTITDFMWGGMENTTLTTLTQRTLFAPETENCFESRGLNAHELAHQWFGDYVTCKDWSNLWLNEGFATYYTHLYREHHLGRPALLYGLMRDAQNRVLPQAKDRRPIVYRGFESPWEQFDYRAYPKGSWVLHMLRNLVGKDLYRQAISSYLKEHAFSPVETDDLREAFEHVTGKPLDRFFDQWVYHPSTPRLKVAWKWDGKSKLAHVSVEQTHPTDDQVAYFHLDTKLRFTLADDSVDHDIRIREKKHDFYVPLAAEPKVVRFDPDYSLLAEVEFKKSDAMLATQAQVEDDVIGRIFACQQLAKRKTEKSIDVLRQRLNHDSFYGVRIEAAKALGKIGNESAVDALLASIKQSDARVRREVVRVLGQRYRPDVGDRLAKIASREHNPAIAAEAIRALGKYHTDASLAAIRQGLIDDSFRHDRLEAATKAIADLMDPSFRNPVAKIIKQQANSLPPSIVSQCMTALVASSQSKKAKRQTYQVLLGYLNHPRQPIARAAVTALGQLGDPRAVPLLEAIRDGRGDEDRMGKAVGQALAQLDRAKPQAPAEIRKLRDQLRKLQEAHDKHKEEIEQLRQKLSAS